MSIATSVRCRHRGGSGTGRPGFTLLEMLLVLAVMIALISIVWPSIMRLYADHQLKQSVEEVRLRMASIRIKALDAGIIYQFRFEPDGTHFLVAPYEADDYGVDESQSDRGMDSSTFHFAGEMPEGLQFRAGTENLFGTERLPEDMLRQFPNSHDLSEVTWSPPLLFYSDGTASDAALEVVDAKHQMIRISVRGLTGAVKVSRVELEMSR